MVEIDFTVIQQATVLGVNMSTNKELWDSVCRTDPKAVKAITGKQYQGNSPKPYWIIEKATEKFGPCGIGWGIEVVKESFQQVSADDYLHTAIVRVWYVYDGKRGQIEQSGGTKASYKTSSGKIMVDEDAAKKSITDGMIKCLSMIGFAGDIFSGRWDDSKYQAEVAAEYAPKPEIDVEYDELVTALAPSITSIKFALSNNDWSTAKESWTELTEEQKMKLWKAPSKGGCFTTEERAKMKSTEFAQA